MCSRRVSVGEPTMYLGAKVSKYRLEYSNNRTRFSGACQQRIMSIVR
jgi:hypothetical protein